jgi:hypothetical protein
MTSEDIATMTKRRFLLPLLVVPVAALGFQANAQPQPATICEANELAAFSCDLGDRQVALCASSVTNKMPGALHFRVRTGGKTSVFPAPEEEKGAFAEYGEWGESSGPPGHYFAITSGAQSYSAFATGGRGEQYGGPEAGFLIEHKGQKPSYGTCADSNTDFDGPGTKLLEKIDTTDGLDRSAPD